MRGGEDLKEDRIGTSANGVPKPPRRVNTPSANVAATEPIAIVRSSSPRHDLPHIADRSKQDVGCHAPSDNQQASAELKIV